MLAFLLAIFGLLCLLVLICFTWFTCEARAVKHQKLNQTTPWRRLVEFLVFNLLALAWLELARLVLGLLGLVALVCLVSLLVLLWFALFCFF